MRTDGELVRDGDAHVLRFERDLAAPLEQVWRAITEPTGLQAWFPATVDLEPLVGGQVSFANDPDFDVDPELLAFSGEVKELDPHRRFAFTWGTDLLRFELFPTDSGCRLVFTHRLAHRAMVNRTVSGWSVCLDALTSSLGVADGESPGWRTYYDHYSAVFGDSGDVDREGDATVIRFERLMPASAADVRAALAADEPLPDPNPGGAVKWQLIPMGDTSLLLVTHTLAGEVDEMGLLGSWDRVLKGLSAAIA